MSQQIIDAVMAQSLQADIARDHTLFAWVVMKDVVDFPGEYVANLVIDAPTEYVLLGQTLAEIRAQLPRGLEHSERQPIDPAGVIEIWFPPP